MWQDTFEAFWDGANQVAIGLGSDTGQSAFSANLFNIEIFSGVDDRSALTLIGVIEARTTAAPWYVVSLPPSHRYIRMQRSDDLDGEQRTHLFLVSELPRSAEWRTAIVQPAAQQLIQIFKRPAASSEEDVVRWVSEHSDGPILWGVLQRRALRRQAGSIHIQISATRLFWPREFRIGIDDNVSRAAKNDVEVTRQDNRPAIYSRLSIDLPPTIKLRIFLGSVGQIDIAFLRRVVLMHVMHQRRQLSNMNLWRRMNHRAEVEPLAIRQVVQTLPESYRHDHFAVDVGGYITAINLADAIEDRSLAASLGFEIEDPPEVSGCVDVNFYGAAFGDDIGLVSSSAAEGDLLVRGHDPGGYPGARLFRISDGGLQALEIDEGEQNTIDIMTVAADHEDLTGTPESLPERSYENWDLLCERLSLPATGDLMGHALNESIGLLAVAAWTNTLVSDTQYQGALGTDLRSYKTFRRAPSLVSALTSYNALIATLDPLHALPHSPNNENYFLQSYAACVGSSNLVAKEFDCETEIEVWRVLSQPTLVQQLLSAQVRLVGSPAEIRENHSLVANQLYDHAKVEEAAHAYEERQVPELSQELNTYLKRRRSGDWIDLAQAIQLAKYCKNIEDEHERIRKLIRLPESPALEPKRRDSRSLPQILADVEKLLDAGENLPKARNEVQRIAGELEKLRETPGTLDRTIVRVFETRLKELVGAHVDDQLTEEIVTAIETWAQLPNFLESIAPRLRTNDLSRARQKRELLQNYVNRVQRSVPKPRSETARFNLIRRGLEKEIRAKLRRSDSDTAERNLLADDITRYGEILFYHRAYCCMEDLIKNTRRDFQPTPSLINEIELRLSAWPHQAEDTWECAVSLASTELLTPPVL